jgi:hypothetical protein
MKEWNKPVIADLEVGFTAGGGLGGAIDGVIYDVVDYGHFGGTQGPKISDPRFKPITRPAP